MEKLLHVDDDPFQLEWVQAVFEGEYQVGAYPDAESALSQLQQLESEEKPTVAILDLDLPGMNGYELCRHLRTDPELEDMAILILSARDSLPDRLEAYNCGADDYFIKPVEMADLHYKVNNLSSLASARRQARLDAMQANQTTFSVMTALGETGVVLGLMRDAASCQDEYSLIQCGLDALAQFGLQAIIEVNSCRGRYLNSHGGEPIPIEQEILQHAKTMDRIFEFRQRAVFNYPSVTILIKDMPLDEERHGRLRDHVAQIAEGMSLRVASLDYVYTALQQQRQLLETRSSLLGLSQRLRSELEQQRENSKNILQEMTHSLETIIHCFDLKETQEHALKEVIDHARFSVEDLQNRELEVETVLQQLIAQLDRALNC